MMSIEKCTAILLTALMLAAAPAPAPEQYYAQALTVMRTLPQPREVTASVAATGEGIGVYAGPSKNDALYATFEAGSDFSARAASWTETYDSATDSAHVDTQAARSLVGVGPLFDPTWRGAYDWLRYGLDGNPHPDDARNVSPSDSPFKTIDTLTVMEPGAYRVSDAGAQQCPNGAAGHHLKFAAKGDWTQHPLTDITVDELTLRFCEVRLRIDPRHVRGGTATVELDYANVNGFWLETHTHADFLGRLFGIGVHHFGLDVDYRVTSVQ